MAEERVQVIANPKPAIRVSNDADRVKAHVESVPPISARNNRPKPKPSTDFISVDEIAVNLNRLVLAGTPLKCNDKVDSTSSSARDNGKVIDQPNSPPGTPDFNEVVGALNNLLSADDHRVHANPSGCSSTDDAEHNTNARDQVLSTEEMVAENTRAYLRGDPHVNYITRNPVFQEFELQARECLRKSFVQKNNDIAEIRRNTASTLLGMSPDFLNNTRLCDLLRDGDNPDSVDELFERIQSGEVWKRQSELHSQPFKLLGTHKGRTYYVDENEEWETENEDRQETESQVGESEFGDDQEGSEPDLFPVAEESEESAGECGTPELFGTPRSSRGVSGPALKKVGNNKQKDLISKLVRPILSPTRRSFASSTMITPAPNPVFQFQGVPTLHKEPRIIKPGEILFSSTGSPVAVPGEQAPLDYGISSNLMVTPSTQSRRPVRLRVDNPDGKSIQVELVCRGRQSNMEEAQLFREFVTDVRGFITTRSTLKNKLMPPRLPTNTAQRSKPAWKHY